MIHENARYKSFQYTVFPKLVSAETMQGRKLFKGGNYSRKYGTLE